MPILKRNGKTFSGTPTRVDTAKSYTTFTSKDAANPDSWEEVGLLASKEKQQSLFSKISTMFKNIRYLYKVLGTSDISGIGDGTITGAVSEMNVSTRQLFSGAFRFFVYDYSEYEPYESYIKEALADAAKNNCCCMVRIKFKYSMNRDYIGSAVAYYAMFDEITYYNNTKRRFKYANGEWEVIELATQAQINNINSNLDSFMNITTAPKIVGSWDGKPVYEQIFRGSISPNATITTMDTSIKSNMHQLVSAYGEVINESGSKAQIGAYLSPTSYSGVYIGTSKLELYHSTGNQYYNATVRYIKL